MLIKEIFLVETVKKFDDYKKWEAAVKARGFTTWGEDSGHEGMHADDAYLSTFAGIVTDGKSREDRDEQIFGVWQPSPENYTDDDLDAYGDDLPRSSGVLCTTEQDMTRWMHEGDQDEPA